ncbi:MAG: nucleoside deaminase [Candidatus Dependentiae bacterium]|nr:nucleoside deaminase [Candidatus Dependentiae bacterium]
MEHDVEHMQRALRIAGEAAAIGEVPIGALVVDAQGMVIGEGCNLVEREQCQDQHAELCAIRAACRARGDWRLEGCTLYVTLEPCIMCIGCIALSRVARLVYGADSPQFGYRGSREDICTLYGGAICNVTTGICRDEVEALMRTFFRQQRAR